MRLIFRITGRLIQLCRRPEILLRAASIRIFAGCDITWILETTNSLIL